MNFLKKHKLKIIFAVIAAAVLTVAFFWSGNVQKKQSTNAVVSISQSQSSKTPRPKGTPSATPKESPLSSPDAAALPIMSEIPIKKPSDEATAENKPEKKDNTPLTASEKEEIAAQIAKAAQQQQADENTQYKQPQTAEAPPLETEEPEYYLESYSFENNTSSTEEKASETTKSELTCTLSVRCDTILDNIAWLNPEKLELVPSDGVIFPESEVVFYEGESVFNLLLREMKKNKIHMEFENTPIYKSAYIEGINNLYEYDCGELSGWMYKVNDCFPNYGCSRYALKQGDRVEFVYTCNLGVDVGGYSAGSENNGYE